MPGQPPPQQWRQEGDVKQPVGNPTTGWVNPAADPKYQQSPQNAFSNNNADFTLIRDPNAYVVGGQQGYAQGEADRYGGIAALGQMQQQGAYGQYQQAYSQQNQARQQQLAALAQVQGLANGTGPSAANAQMMQGLASARQQQASIAANARGGGAGLAAAQQAAAQQGSNIATTGAGQAATLRSQEQLGAIGQYGQMAGQLRASDFGAAQLSTAQQQQSAQQAQAYEQMKQGMLTQQSQYQQAAEQQALAREAATRGWNLQQRGQDQAQENTWINAGVSAASTAAMIGAMALSDERAKEGVSDGGADVDDAIDKLRPVNFSYKAGLGQLAGEHTGIMAQHLASSKAGSKAVMQGDDGYLRVKAPEAATLALAGLARLSQRLKKLESNHAD
jgi:hypothetical protein